MGCAYPLCPSAHSTPRSPPSAMHLSTCLIVASSCLPKIFVLLSIATANLKIGALGRNRPSGLAKCPYQRRDFLATACHASTSERVFVGDAQRTALIESKRTVEKGSRIAEASSFFADVGIFL